MQATSAPPPYNASCLPLNSHSQFGEDSHLQPWLRQAAVDGKGGVFVELGALDGVLYSNTLALEQCHGWTGLLIEANPIMFRHLERCARRARVVHSAICAKDDTAQILVGQKDPATASTVVRRPNNGTRYVDVPCRPLSSLIRDAGLGSVIDFLSLDVEGAEDIVLETMGDILFKIILVETNRRSMTRVRNLLASANMTRVAVPALRKSETWIRPELVGAAKPEPAEARELASLWRRGAHAGHQRDWKRVGAVAACIASGGCEANANSNL